MSIKNVYLLLVVQLYKNIITPLDPYERIRFSYKVIKCADFLWDLDQAWANVTNVTGLL